MSNYYHFSTRTILNHILNYINFEISKFAEQYVIDIKNWIKRELECWNKQKEKIAAKDAYLFLSMLKEYVEPKGKFDANRYGEFRFFFESIFRAADIVSDFENPEISITVYRLLYHLFEKARAEDIIQRARAEDITTSEAIVQNKGKLLYQPLI